MSISNIDKLIDALKECKQYFLDYEGNDVRKLARLLMKIDSALASVEVL